MRPRPRRPTKPPRARHPAAGRHALERLPARAEGSAIASDLGLMQSKRRVVAEARGRLQTADPPKRASVPGTVAAARRVERDYSPSRINGGSAGRGERFPQCGQDAVDVRSRRREATRSPSRELIGARYWIPRRFRRRGRPAPHRRRRRFGEHRRWTTPRLSVRQACASVPQGEKRRRRRSPVRGGAPQCEATPAASRRLRARAFRESMRSHRKNNR